MKPIEVAISAAKQAGKIILDSWGKLQSKQIVKKNMYDYVTRVDNESEQAIMNMIQDHFPDHSIMAEESGEKSLQSAYRWIIDPLDGTTNYIHSYPVCAVPYIRGEFYLDLALRIYTNPIFG